MPFCLTNVPIVSWHVVNVIFRDFLDLLITVYLDTFLIFSKTQEEHIVDVHQVLQQLQEYGIYAKLKKCNFDHNQVKSMDA